MKKVIALCFFLLASLACGSYASAAQVDLQPRNVRFVDHLTISNIPSFHQTGLYVYVQNNGTEDFQGTFMLKLWSYSGDTAFNYSGTISAESYQEIRLPIASAKDIYSIQVDSRNDVVESNEDNNYFFYEDGAPQVAIISNGMVARDYRNTFFVLPGEYFYQEFSVAELNWQKAIIGFCFEAYAYDFQHLPAQDYFFGVEYLYRPIDPQTGELYGGKFSFKSASGKDKAYCQWMANLSDAALYYFWLGYFRGVAKNMPVGLTATISIGMNYATNNLQNKYYGVRKVIKVIDRMRCDVNDDGVVNYQDLDILIDVVNNGLDNPYVSFKNLYQEKGMNYGAGIILFSQPDFASNCLLNIWLHSRLDPLVQGLGIGEMMSAVNSQSAIERVANSFSVSNNELVIDAPEADIYNVTAQQADGKFFQATGKIGEKISVPDPTLNYRVETVRLNNSEVATKLFAPKVQDNQLISVRSTRFSDQINISGTGKLTIVNLSGQTLFTGNLDGNELNIPTSNWSTGMYIVKAVSGGKVQTIKLVK